MPGDGRMIEGEMCLANGRKVACRSLIGHVVPDPAFRAIDPLWSRRGRMILARFSTVRTVATTPSIAGNSVKSPDLARVGPP